MIKEIGAVSPMQSGLITMSGFAIIPGSVSKADWTHLLCQHDIWKMSVDVKIIENAWPAADRDGIWHYRFWSGSSSRCRLWLLRCFVCKTSWNMELIADVQRFPYIAEWLPYFAVLFTGNFNEEWFQWHSGSMHIHPSEQMDRCLSLYMHIRLYRYIDRHQYIRLPK